MIILLLVLTAPIIASSDAALAGTCDHEAYVYNGSTLALEQCNGAAITISYQRPHAQLRKHGIKPGTKLFVGIERRDGLIAGTMWVYKSGCARIRFIVRGAIGRDGIRLKGRVPVRDNKCDVVRTRAQDFIFTLP